MAYLSYKELRAEGACKDGLALFEKHFGQGGEVTLDLCLEHASTFDWGWAARHLLSAEGWKAYDGAVALALKAYKEAVALALKAYDEAVALASKAYDEAEALASKAYKEAVAPASKAYDEAVALAWFAAWEKDHLKRTRRTTSLPSSASKACTSGRLQLIARLLTRSRH